MAVIGFLIGHILLRVKLISNSYLYVHEQNDMSKKWIEDLYGNFLFYFKFFHTLLSFVFQYWILIILILIAITITLLMLLRKPRFYLDKTRDFVHTDTMNAYFYKDEKIYNSHNANFNYCLINGSAEIFIFFGINFTILKYTHNYYFIILLFILTIYLGFRADIIAIFLQDKDVFFFKNDMSKCKLYNLAKTQDDFSILSSKIELLLKRKQYVLINSVVLIFPFLFYLPNYFILLPIFVTTFFIFVLLFKSIVIGELKTNFQAFQWVKEYDLNTDGLEIWEIDGFGILSLKNNFFTRLFISVFLAFLLFGAYTRFFSEYILAFFLILSSIALLLVILQKKSYIKELVVG
ncbi:MAG: hypothetical protein LBI63_00885 [Candidatus Ancillula sp.]|jgi:hypothetical protein|nr:hypothetical protein [Candidatus Ancillula sp.]